MTEEKKADAILLAGFEAFNRAVSDAGVMLALAGGQSERADVLAFLEKRRRAAQVMLSRSPEEQAKAEIIYQQIGIEIEAIEQGLHVGDAACEEALAAAPVESNTFNEDVAAGSAA